MNTKKAPIRRLRNQFIP